MKKHKWLIIGVIVLLIIAVILFVFRKKIAKKQVADSGADNINLDIPQPKATVPATQPKEITLGSSVYSNAKQQITRIELRDGHYSDTDKEGVSLGSGQIGKNSLIGTVVKLTPNGYYVKAKPGLTAKYYWVGLSQVYTK